MKGVVGTLRFDKIGYWSELKLDIVREYATAYSKILTARNLYHVYIDAFAGGGIHFSKASREFVPGSPLNALSVDPPFKEFFFIDLDSEKTDLLKQLVGDRKDVHIYPGDANDVLLTKVFPQVRYSDFRRGLCLLDPYGLHLNWEVVKEAGKLNTIDMFLNFPIMDMNMNFLWRYPEKLEISETNRMNAFWGDDSWRRIAYRTQPSLFGPQEVKEENSVIVDTYCQRMQKVAKFKHVVRSLPMRNTTGAIVYYLLFASQQQLAEEIVDYIFRKYENRGTL